MGASGEDILFSPLARKTYPFSIECKHVERLNIWDAIEQANSQNRDYTPIVAFRKNNQDAYVALPLEKFLEILSEKQNNNS